MDLDVSGIHSQFISDQQVIPVGKTAKLITTPVAIQI